MDYQKSVLAARLILGLPFVVFGLNGFLHFIPYQPMPGPAMDLMMAFMRSGYMMPFVAGTQVIAGLLLVSGFFVPLGLLLLAPMVAHIIMFHLFLTPGIHNQILPLVILALGLFLASKYCKVFAPLLKPRQPDN